MLLCGIDTEVRHTLKCPYCSKSIPTKYMKSHNAECKACGNEPYSQKQLYTVKNTNRTCKSYKLISLLQANTWRK